MSSSLFFECVPKYRRMMVPLHSLGKRQAAAEIMEEDSAVAGSGHNLKSVARPKLTSQTYSLGNQYADFGWVDFDLYRERH